ncbi:amino acid ABC transporter permease [Phaeobacter sp. HF9A]|uniref:amino acid ABC transporter permease n=1 Tax=Phaeobacter sp. HF9A TaxID=2721561 RepID=UPI00142F59F9|nr:amino acid ABC transporter permease [Phaeobacter sp. HF9A]NIZ14814.1 amino acid ABC transporter permease [Phaeobacter sp. HF9A]
MSDISFVRKDMLPPKEPPASEVGVLGWLKVNLFSTWLNSLLSVVALAFVSMVIYKLLSWALVPTWHAKSLSECREIFAALGKDGHNSAACWGVIRDRWPQLLFGFYPNGAEEGVSDQRWRPVLDLLLLGVAMAPVLFSEKVPRKLIYFTYVYPFIMPWLLWGGPIWTPICIAAGFVIAYVVYRVLGNIFGSLVGLVAAVATALVWWLFLSGPIASGLASILPIGLEPVASRQFGGMMLSITIGVVAIACSLPLGILLALGRQSDLLIVKSLCVGFIEFIRGVPLITLLFVASTLLNIFMPPGTNFDIIMRVIIMATLFASAYMAEVIRGGLAALPKGQYEGADSLGLDYWQAQRLIIMPQALKISIPGIVSTFIGLFKDTTLVSVIGLLDPLGLTNAIRADAAWNGVVWELYGFIAFMFFVCCFSMSRYSMYLERKLQTGHR